MTAPRRRSTESTSASVAVVELDPLSQLLAGYVGKVGAADDSLADMLVQPAPLGIGDVVRYNHLRKQWHYWNDVRWRGDGMGYVQDLIRKRAVMWLSADVLTGTDNKAVLSLLGTGKKETVLTSLSRRETIAMKGDEWDQDPYLLGFENGILDLRTMEFDPKPSSTTLISKSVGYDWEPTADAGEFWSFLKDIMSKDDELAGYLGAVLGYSLFGLQSEQKFWMWTGGGQNGKGILARTMVRVLGEYADSPSDTMYMRTRFGTVPSSAARPDLMRLQGIRFTYMSEPQGGQFNEELLKAHTGEDLILARDLYGKAGEFAQFSPTHKIIFLCNELPKTVDVGVSMRRRARVIKFQETYLPPDHEPDNMLEERLKGLKAGIIVGLAAFARAWWNEGKPGMVEPANVRHWSDAYIASNDPLAPFLRECCIIEQRVTGSTRDLWTAYEDWAIRSNIEAMSQTGFGLALGKRFKKVHTEKGNAWQGVRAKSALEYAEGVGDE